MIFIFLVFLSFSSLFADQNHNAYIVKNVNIERADTSANQAKEKALLDSQNQAFWLLIHRMVMDEDLAKIPQDIDLKEITSLIRNFSVISERTTPTTYSAVLDYEFDPDAVKSFFNQHLVGYVENFIPDMLILPLMINDGTVLLWEEKNLWMHAWKMMDEDFKTRLPYKIPLSDVTDLSILQGNDAFQQRRDKIEQLARKYNVQNILTCILNVSGQDSIDINLEIKHYQSSGGESFLFPSAHYTGPITEELLKKIKQEALNNSWKTWKKQGTLIANQTQEFLCNVVVDDVKKLKSITDRLNQVRIIKKNHYTMIAKGSAQLSLTFSTNLDFLKEELSKVGLDLSETASQWYLKLK